MRNQIFSFFIWVGREEEEDHESARKIFFSCDLFWINNVPLFERMFLNLLELA